MATSRLTMACFLASSRAPTAIVTDGAGVAYVTDGNCNIRTIALATATVGTLVGGPGNALGEPVAIGAAEDHIFGLCLLNDWSARDVQAWEYVPLGPFAAKNFCTTISPWVVTLEALEPFRCATSTGAQDPPPLAYLRDPRYGSYDVRLEVAIRPAAAAAA